MNSSLVYLVQTDTTVGFLSFDDKKLSLVKQRDLKQKTLQVVDSFKTLNQKLRVPKNRKSKIRRAKQTTFIYPNGLSFRVVDKTSSHINFIKKFKCLYSTSANKTKTSFDFDFAVDSADVVLYNKDLFYQTKSSSIYKVTKKRIIKIR